MFYFLKISYCKPVCGLWCPDTTEYDSDTLQYFLSRCLSNNITFTTARNGMSSDNWQQSVTSTSQLWLVDGIINLTRLWHNPRLVQKRYLMKTLYATNFRICLLTYFVVVEWNWDAFYNIWRFISTFSFSSIPAFSLDLP